jgi:hypothetical protein
MQLQRQHEMDEAAANEAIQRSMVEELLRRQKAIPRPEYHRQFVLHNLFNTHAGRTNATS